MNPTYKDLTPAQIGIIKQTWATPAANPTDSGVAIFYAFLEKFPANKADFANFKDLPLSDLKVSIFFAVFIMSFNRAPSEFPKKSVKKKHKIMNKIWSHK
jgi:hypothetical protein